MFPQQILLFLCHHGCMFDLSTNSFCSQGPKNWINGAVQIFEIRVFLFNYVQCSWINWSLDSDWYHTVIGKVCLQDTSCHLSGEFLWWNDTTSSIKICCHKEILLANLQDTDCLENGCSCLCTNCWSSLQPSLCFFQYFLAQSLVLSPWISCPLHTQRLLWNVLCSAGADLGYFCWRGQ